MGTFERVQSNRERMFSSCNSTKGMTKGTKFEYDQINYKIAHSYKLF